MFGKGAKSEVSSVFDEKIWKPENEMPEMLHIDDVDHAGEDNLLSFDESMQDDEIKQDQGGVSNKASIDEMFLVN
jgi:hypothetical protein